MDITMITCAFLPECFVLLQMDAPEMLNLSWVGKEERRQELCRSVVSYAEYTWIKAKRVLDKWKDPYKSSKNVYFVFRILELGHQLLTHDRIVDLRAANLWYHRICEIYERYKVAPGDFDIVEAALAREYELEVERFRNAVTRSQRPPVLATLSTEKSDDCGICLDRLEANKTNKKQPLLCGHAFHFDCIVKWIRHQGRGPSSCPMCRRSLCTDINREVAIRRELERRGIRRPLGFRGCPATIVVDGSV